MAKAKECDKCGGLYKIVCDIPIVQVTVYYPNDGNREIDLCPQCKESLMKWLERSRQSAVEAEPKHGRWDNPSKYGLSDKFDGLGAVCSACACFCDNLFNYCPNCGAKMDGGNEDA